MRVLFADLDGTIRRPLGGKKFIATPDDQELIPGMKEAIVSFTRDRDWELIGITNQAGVAAGHKTLDDCIKEQFLTMQLLPLIKEINFCTDFEGTIAYRLTRAGELVHLPPGRNYRKPGAGMLDQYSDIYSFSECAIMIGDRDEDHAAALAAGISFMWADVFLKNYGIKNP
ncbi:MAG: HAD hydrolase-like protein [Dolichospermum sp.]